MADLSIREQIVANIKTRFSDVVANTKQWKTSATATEDLPGIVIRDLTCESFDDVVEHHGHRLTVEVEVAVAEGTTTISEIRNLIAELQGSIGEDDTWTNLAILTEPSSDEILMSEDKQIIGGAKITFIVYFRTLAWDAFHQ